MFNNNLGNWLAGDAKARELEDTRRRWDVVEARWRASPLANRRLDDHVMAVVDAAADPFPQRPPVPLLVELAMAAQTLLSAEEIGALEPDWPRVSEDVEVAVRFRQMLIRRGRWTTNFDEVWATASEGLAGAMGALIERLPPPVWAEWDDETPALGVPLVDLVEDLPGLLDHWVLFAFQDGPLRLDLFAELRAALKRNLLIASGYAPDDPKAREDRLVFPSQHKGGLAAAALAELYLGGTPLAPVLELAVPFQVPDAARFEHCHILGGTGHGKTQFMQRMILDDLQAAGRERRGLIVIDSQGDLIGKLTRLAIFDPDGPNSLAERLVVIDPADVEHPAALNLFDAHLQRLETYSPVDRERVLNGVIELYEVFFGALLGAELTQKQGVIFKYLARLMIAIPGATIHTLMEIMEDGRPYRDHMARLDGSARHFFETEFFQASFAATKKQILRRLWGVLSTPAFERMFAQPHNRLDLFAAMNAGKIVLINTAKDLLKTEGSQLFGRFFVALVAQAALERSTLAEDERTPVFVYIDEAQEYVDERIETILTQARKYRVGLTIAHQTLDQLTPRLRAALAANTSLKCVGGVSAKDARAMADELHTSVEFIESMRRRPERTEFAVWLKHHTPAAIRLSAPLGALERQPMLPEETFEALRAENRRRYCGTWDEAVRRTPRSGTAAWNEDPAAAAPPQQTPPASAVPQATPDPPPHPSQTADPGPAAPGPPSHPRARPSASPDYRPGKGGGRHKYLQALIKELGEQQGFRAVIEAPVASGSGQADVLLKRGELQIAFEISVTTSLDQERENLRKHLAGDIAHIAVVVAKAPAARKRFATGLIDPLTPDDRARVSVLAPEELVDYIAALAPPPEPSETVVRGYKVRVTHTVLPPHEARLRREALARILAKSLSKAPD